MNDKIERSSSVVLSVHVPKSFEIGTETKCYCGRTIVWQGVYWNHLPGEECRHMAKPANEELIKHEEDDKENATIYVHLQ